MIDRRDEYEKLWEEEVWRLFYALMKSVEREGLPLLDRLRFSDFAAFCRRYTSRGVAAAGREKVMEKIFLEAYGDLVCTPEEQETAVR